MTITLEIGHVLLIVISLMGFFTGMVKLLLAQLTKHLDEKLTKLGKDAESWRTVERDLMQLKIDLPERYVRREDYIRNQTVIEIKLDGIRETVQLLQRQMDRRQENLGPPNGIERRDEVPGPTG